VIRNVILDWSGTLVDDLTPVFKTTNHVLAECGLPAITLDGFRREFCLPIRKFYEQRTPGVPQEKLEKIFLTRFREHQGEITLLPQTMEFLRFCQRNRMGVYIGSTVDADTYNHQARRFGIGRYITRPYIGIVDKTEIIHEILEQNRLDRDQTMFVGDMEHDIEAGKAGGIHTCAVLTGYNHVEKLRAMQPDLVCEHLGELQQILSEQLVGRG
jgi:phosphoglycolate phosphatase-like HAD superfamily hydrolase